MARNKLAQIPRRARAFGWGFVDQGFASATTFLLSLVAARALGPSGLGVIAVGFSAYLVFLISQRGFLTEPLVASTAALPPRDREKALRLGLTVSISCSVAGALLLLTVGATVQGPVGRGLLLFAPWLVPALVQDYWRATLFMERRARAAAMTDAVWFLLLCGLSPLLLVIARDWIVVCLWGFGALGGMILGAVCARVWPGPARESLAWWRCDVWPLGRWLGTSGVLYTATSYAATVALAGVLGARNLGGLRAVYSALAPLSLIAPAISLPGLPAISRATFESREDARAMALRLGTLGVASASIYLMIFGFNGERLLSILFGSSFATFSGLILPIGLGQILAAATLGFTLLLTAEQRGEQLLVVGIVAAAGSLGPPILLGLSHGVEGAAWGFACGSALTAVLTTAFALCVSSDQRPDAPQLLAQKPLERA
jgi:O-antigen/teichoic acid export membrane protein